MSQLSEEQKERLVSIRERFRVGVQSAYRYEDIQLLLSMLDSDSQAGCSAVLLEQPIVRSDADVRQLFDAWWRVNHPFSWWAEERGGEPLPESDRQMVRDLSERAFYAAEVLSLTAATAMRDKCVEKVKTHFDCNGAHENGYGCIFNLADELQSLTLDQVKPGEK